MLVYATPTCYLNEKERNVHIWAASRDIMTGHLILLGGFFVNGAVSWPVLFQWMNVFMRNPEDEDDDEELCLLPWDDPRIHDLPRRQRRQGKKHLFQGVGPEVKHAKLDQPVKIGHYILCLRHKTERGFQALDVPQIRDCLNDEENPRPIPQKEPKYNRKETVRTEVRIRDGGCLATGAIASPRCRGQNHTGFHVAHIYPLEWRMDYWRDWFSRIGLLPEEIYTPLEEDVDVEKNCIELQASVHYAFDDHLFGFWKGDIYPFECSGGQFLNDQITSLIAGPVSKPLKYSKKLDDLTAGALQFRFEYGILLNCVGGGRPIPPSVDKRLLLTIEPKPDLHFKAPF